MGQSARFSAVAVTVVLLVASCSSSGDDTERVLSPSPSSTIGTPSTDASVPDATPSPTTSEATTFSVEHNIQRAWLNYWKVSLTLTDHPRTEWAVRVREISVDPIYTELLNSIRVQQDKLGEVGYGYVVSHPYWPTPPTTASRMAVMGDCFDGSHAGTKVATTDKVKTVGKTHTNIHATLVKGVDGKWRVNQIQYLKASC